MLSSSLDLCCHFSSSYPIPSPRKPLRWSSAYSPPTIGVRQLGVYNTMRNNLERSARPKRTCSREQLYWMANYDQCSSCKCCISLTMMMHWSMPGLWVAAISIGNQYDTILFRSQATFYQSLNKTHTSVRQPNARNLSICPQSYATLVQVR